MYNLLYTIFKVNVDDIKPNIKNQPKKLFHDVYGRMQKKNAWVVLCAVTPFINVAMKVCNIKRKIRIGLFPTWYFMWGFGQKNFWHLAKKGDKKLFFIFLRPLLFFQVHEEMYFESDGGGKCSRLRYFLQSFHSYYY